MINLKFRGTNLPYASFSESEKKEWGFGGETLSERPEETTESFSSTSEFGSPPKLLVTFSYKSNVHCLLSEKNVKFFIFLKRKEGHERPSNSMFGSMRNYFKSACVYYRKILEKSRDLSNFRENILDNMCLCCCIYPTRWTKPTSFLVLLQCHDG